MARELNSAFSNGEANVMVDKPCEKRGITLGGAGTSQTRAFWSSVLLVVHSASLAAGAARFPECLRVGTISFRSFRAPTMLANGTMRKAPGPNRDQCGLEARLLSVAQFAERFTPRIDSAELKPSGSFQPAVDPLRHRSDSSSLPRKGGDDSLIREEFGADLPGNVGPDLAVADAPPI